ncbi:MAG: DUF1289 domain-containing protein [Pseudomonadales bacterium]
MSHEQAVPSPCVQICCLDMEDVCIGCYRTAREITDWSELSNDEKKSIIQLTHKRYQDKYSND